jgi:hypothetical protein
MDDFRFILVAWLMVMILTDDKKPKTFLKKIGMIAYFVGFASLFLASFAIPALRELFIWFALYPLVLEVVRFVITKLHGLGRGLFKRELVVDDDASV